jgi:hypothetical protein
MNTVATLASPSASSVPINSEVNHVNLLTDAVCALRIAQYLLAQPKLNVIGATRQIVLALAALNKIRACAVSFSSQGSAISAKGSQP